MLMRAVLWRAVMAAAAVGAAAAHWTRVHVPGARAVVSDTAGVCYVVTRRSADDKLNRVYHVALSGTHTTFFRTQADGARAQVR